MNKMHFENRKLSREFFWFIWFLYALVYMTKTCFTAAMASIVFENIMTKSQVGLIAAVFYLVYAPFQIVGGIFADKYDPENLIIIGLLGGSLANLIIFFNQNYYVVLAVWTFNAMIQFGIWPSIFKIISSQIVRSDKKNATYYISFSSTAGLILSYGAAALVTKWYYNFALSAFVLFALAVALFIITKVAKPYMKPDKAPVVTPQEAQAPTENASVFKLFLTSGFFLLAVIGFIVTSVGNGVKNLSATWLMETYEGVTPRSGNFLNIVIIAVSVIGILLVRTVLYPKIIKSAPTGIFAILLISLAFSGVLLLGNIGLPVSVVSMCVLSASNSMIFLLMNYCTLRFEKFGKSATAAGLINMSASLGLVMCSYGITKIADLFHWHAVSRVFFGLLAVSVILILLVLPLWKRFKKKYYVSHQTPLVTESR